MKSSLKIKVEHPAGLHARPASMFVKTANTFSSNIFVQNLNVMSEPVNAKSILGILTLGVSQNHEIEIVADGEDAEIAVNALKNLIDSNFGGE
jgi:phosphotransferase system HPr (HPr) family protein